LAYTNTPKRRLSVPNIAADKIKEVFI
jgi:hypothetical protein